MTKKQKKNRGRKEVYETDVKIHGLRKNKNKYCEGCVDKEDCLTGRMAAIALCEDYKGE